MLIYDVPSIIIEALPFALNVPNIIKEFQILDVEPYNIDLFSDCNFCCQALRIHTLSVYEDHKIPD